MKESNAVAYAKDWEYKKAQHEERKAEKNKRVHRARARGRVYQPLSSEE